MTAGSPVAYHKALERSEAGTYEVAGSSVPFILLPVVAPLVRTRQWLEVRGRRLERRLAAARLWRSTTRSGLPRTRFGDLVLLRSFGNDGGVTIATGEGPPEPLETYLDRIARRLGYNGVVALAYGADRARPVGPTYCVVGDERWQADIAAALDGCSGIIVLLHDSTQFRDGFAHELRLIASRPALSDKTVLVATRRPTDAAHAVVTGALSFLGWPIPEAVPIACTLMADGRLGEYVVDGHGASGRDEYLRAFVSCLRQTPHFDSLFEPEG